MLNKPNLVTGSCMSHPDPVLTTTKQASLTLFVYTLLPFSLDIMQLLSSP